MAEYGSPASYILMIILEGSGDIRWQANAQNSNQDDASGRQSKQSIVNCIFVYSRATLLSSLLKTALESEELACPTESVSS